MLTDAELVDGVVAGYDDAFAQLYERHSLAAWRLGQTVTGNADDAADAVSEAFARVLVAVRAGHLDKGGSFRSYLLTATRNAALDNIRKTSRARPTDQEQLSEVESTSLTPSEHLTNDEEAALVAEAFRNLPERWRSVLWLTEVEGVATKDAAQRLGLSPNGAAQLAVRARTGLRERFLQAHLRKTVDPQCRTTVDRLGAYVGGGLSPRDLAKVDQHLAGCSSCEARRRELEDVGTCLRRAALPVPLALVGGLGAAGTPALFGLGTRMAKAMSWAQEAWATKAAAAAAAGIIAVGAGGAYFAGSGGDGASAGSPNTAALVADPSDALSAGSASDEAASTAPPTTAPTNLSGSTAPDAADQGAEQAQVPAEPECLRPRLDAGPATLSAGAGELALSRVSPGASDAAPTPDDQATAEGDGGEGAEHFSALGGVIDRDGLDRSEIDADVDAEAEGEGEGVDGSAAPGLDTEVGVELGDIAARLALAADLARAGGIGVGLDASSGDSRASTSCGTGIAGDVEVPFSPEGR